MGYLKWIWNHIWKVDKLLHALSGLCIYLFFLHYINPYFAWEDGIALVPVVIAGIAKELWDEFVKETGGDPWDFFATLFFALIFYLVSIFI